MNVGDTVNYVPDLIHAFERNASGNYTWEMALKKNVRNKGGRTEEVLEPLDDEAITRIKKKGDVSKIVFTAPNLLWKGKVTSINEDETVNLNLPGGTPQVTLHYDNVKVDSKGTVPGTCSEIVTEHTVTEHHE